MVERGKLLVSVWMRENERERERERERLVEDVRERVGEQPNCNFF